MDPIGSPQECGTFTFTWSGGNPPYTFTINAADHTLFRNPFGDNGTEATSYTWNPVDVSAGTYLFAGVGDSSRQPKFSASGLFEIQPGDGGCSVTVRPSGCQP